MPERSSAIVPPAVMRMARSVARQRMREGALAVVLSGSYARGDASAESDVDLIAVLGRAPEGGHLRDAARQHGRYLVHTAWATLASVRADFTDPGAVGTNVPGWRVAVPVEDTGGTAAKLMLEAQRWTWDRIGDARCDAWVARAITGWAEEVHKLVSALSGGAALNAAAQRSLLALHLAHIVAVHRRMLFGTDNVMWDLVAAAMGTEWRAAQSAAFGLDGESLERSSRAALRLYALAAGEVMPTLDRRQSEVVVRANDVGSARADRVAQTGRKRT